MLSRARRSLLVRLCPAHVLFVLFAGALPLSAAIDGPLYPPAALRSLAPTQMAPPHQVNPGAALVVLHEDFVGAWPGPWTIWANPSWGPDSYRAHGGSYSGFCAKSGPAGVDPPAHYLNNMCARIACGPLDLNRYLISCIRRGIQPTTNFNDAVKTMELIEAIYQHRIGPEPISVVEPL